MDFSRLLGFAGPLRRRATRRSNECSRLSGHVRFLHLETSIFPSHRILLPGLELQEDLEAVEDSDVVVESGFVVIFSMGDALISLVDRVVVCSSRALNQNPWSLLLPHDVLFCFEFRRVPAVPQWPFTTHGVACLASETVIFSASPIAPFPPSFLFASI